MDYSLKLVTAPLKEPLSLAEVKLDRGIDLADATFNTSLELLISAARRWVEHFTHRHLIEQTWDLLLPKGFPWLEGCHYLQDPHEIRIPRAPLKATGGITHVKYLDSNGAQQTFAAGAAGYIVGARSEPALIAPAFGISWPSTRDHIDVNGNYPVEVRFIAGYGSQATDVPEDLRKAMLLLIGHWHENREAVDPGIGGQLDPIPMGLEAILWQYRFSPW